MIALTMKLKTQGMSSAFPRCSNSDHGDAGPRIVCPKALEPGKYVFKVSLSMLAGKNCSKIQSVGKSVRVSSFTESY